ncbi:basic proline-rich protein-like [Pteropus medius]|uniref:basic proline-rich protein-like n=1 Tax=Pteropus vampyrus TaxID=132908 RepID=UPI00196A31E1|nr:basic proline-rich protein-like [Pteropus giganteus]
MAAGSPGGGSSPAEAAAAAAPGARGCGGRGGRGDGGESLWRPPPPNRIPPPRPALRPYLPLPNFFPGINKPAARGGHSRPCTAPPPPAPGPSGLLLPSCDSPAPAREGACARRRRRRLAKLFLPPSRAGHFRDVPDPPRVLEGTAVSAPGAGIPVGEDGEGPRLARTLLRPSLKLSQSKRPDANSS